MSAKNVVIAATDQLFNKKDVRAVDELFGPIYVQHSALGADGVVGLKALVSSLPETAGYELTRVLADGELVVTEGVFTGFAPVPLTGYDVWRVIDDWIVEHWDALSAAATQSSGKDTSVDDATLNANRALIGRWTAEVLVAGDRTSLASYLAPGADVTLDDSLAYSVVHAVVADQDVVYTRSEGVRDGSVIINDMWRIADGKIDEHWQLVAAVPDKMPHSNGAF